MPNFEVIGRHEDTVLFSGSCASSNSYCVDKRGDTPGLSSVTGLEHWPNSRLFSLKNYRLERRPAQE